MSHIEWDKDNVAAVLEQGCCLESSIPLVLPKVVVTISTRPNLKAQLTNQEWKQEQRSDPDICEIIQLLENNQLLNYKTKGADMQNVRIYLKYRKDVVIRNGLLYRKMKLKNYDMVVFQFVLPNTYHKKTLISLHNDIGHMGMDCTFNLVQDRFFWPRMSESIRMHIRNWERCMKFKQMPERAEMCPTESSYPLELIHMDFLTIGKVGSDKLVNIFIVADHFTKYTQAYVTPNQMAKVVARTLWENFLIHYEWPTKILTDQGKTFESSLVKELCSISQVRKIRTTPYRPEKNGACERFNQTLINMLGTLLNEVKKDWQEWVSMLMHAYSCAISDSTGFKPYFLMYGWEPQLAIDIEYEVT